MYHGVEGYINRAVPPQYRKNYVDYGEMKLRIQSAFIALRDDLSTAVRETPASIIAGAMSKCLSKMDAEIEKVNLFAINISEGVMDKCRMVMESILCSKEIDKKMLNLFLDGLTAEIAHLDTFVRVNLRLARRLFTMIQISFREYRDDAPLAYRDIAILKRETLPNEPFCRTDVERLVLNLSICWEELRIQTSRQTLSHDVTDSTDRQWIPPSSFSRTTSKYWVSPDDVADCKLAIIRHVPYLIMDKTHAELVKELLSSTGEVDQGPADSQLVSSVYFDNMEGRAYNHRINRYEGACLIRYRWYGWNDGSPNKAIYIERKTHHEGWSGETSVKERFEISQSVAARLSRNEDVDFEQLGLSGERLTLAREVASHQKEFSLLPMIRTSYQRVAFQSSISNDIRFSLDTNLNMIDELSGGTVGGHWCRTAENALSRNAVTRFPLAILEVKLKASQPAWVTDMLNKCHALSMYKFSKFQHGIAILHQPIIKSYTQPHWVEHCIKRKWDTGFESRLIEQHRDPLATFRGDNQSPGLDFVGDAAAYLSIFHSRRSMEIANVAESRNSRRSFKSSGSRATAWEISPRKRDIDGKGYDGDRSKLLAWYQLRNRISPLDDVRFSINRLDPKVHFAIERTYLKFIRKSIFIYALALILIDRGASVVVTLPLLLLAIIIIAIAMYHLLLRFSGANQHRQVQADPNTRPPLHSKVGIRILTLTLLGVMTGVTILSLP